MSDKPENAEPDTNTPTPIVLGRLELSPQRIELSLERACAETFKPCHIFPPDALALAMQGKLLPAPKVRP
jgi:acyl-CoA synthetase (AMP-forming)/AMP-acid ligase II